MAMRREWCSIPVAGWPIAGLLLLALAVAPATAQPTAEELSQQAANPIANLISFPLQNNTDFGLGPYDRSANVLNVQPVIPLAEGRWITRTVVPFVWIPDVTTESGQVSSGLSDVAFTAFYVPGAGETMWGVGPILEFPTGGELRGSKKWSAGLSGVLLKQPGNWTLGLLFNNVWSYAGDSDREDVNKGLLQYFVVYQLGGGWYVNTAPILNVDWKAPAGQRWKVPFGAGGGKLMWWGKLPVNVQAQAYWFAEAPDVGPDWQLRLQVQTLLPVPGS
jgi:hypothetical protein